MGDHTDILERESRAARLAECYCSVYSGDPWHQNFDPQATTEWIEELERDPNVTIETVDDEDGVVQAFYIAYKGTPQEATDKFREIFPQIISVPIDGQTPEEMSVEQLEDNTNLVYDAIKDANKVLYIMDIGIRPESREQRTRLSILIAVFRNALGTNRILGQTLSKGPMSRIIQKFNPQILLNLPIGSQEDEEGAAHLVFNFETSKLMSLGTLKLIGSKK